MKKLMKRASFIAALLFLLVAVIPFGTVLADTAITSVTVEFSAVKGGDSVSSFRSSLSCSQPGVDKSSLSVSVSPSDSTFVTDKSYTITISGRSVSGFVFASNNNLKFIVNFNGARVSSTNNASASKDSFSYSFSYKVPSNAQKQPEKEPKPKVTKSPSDETVTVGGSCSFIAHADVETHIDWYFNDTKGKEYTCSEAKSALKGLRTKGEKDEKIIISRIPQEMDGWKVFAVFSNNVGEYTETKKATIHVTQAKPNVTKSPSGETVQEGGTCSFIARADGAETITWYLTNGKDTVAAKSAAKKFSGLTVSGSTEEKLKLSNIPLSLDGWKAYAEFENEAGKVESDKAAITVTVLAPAVTEAPALTPEPDSGESASSDPVDDPGDGPIDEPADDHEHTFSLSWDYDENEHFHVCDCGEHADAAQHDMTWQVIKKATKKADGEQIGICSVCGYMETAVIPASGSGGTKTLLIVLLIVCGVLLVGCAVFLGLYLYREAQKKKRRERRRRLREEVEADELFDNYDEEEIPRDDGYTDADNGPAPRGSYNVASTDDFDYDPDV